LAKFLLKGVHLLADRRLSQIHLLGRRVKPAGLADRTQDLQLPKGHLLPAFIAGDKQILSQAQTAGPKVTFRFDRRCLSTLFKNRIGQLLGR
jgi:hypothetical protein